MEGQKRRHQRIKPPVKIIGIPIFASLLAIMFIGFPVTIFVVGLFLTWLFTAYLALVVGQVIVHRFRRERSSGFWSRISALSLGILILAVVALIPVLGAVLTIAVLMIGFGAMTMQMIGSRSSATF